MRTLFCIVMIFTLTGCGSKDDAPPPAKIYGTVQVGASKEAIVYLKDAKQTQFVTRTDKDGNYSFDVERLGIQRPAMIKAVFGNTSTAFNIVDGDGSSLINLNQANTLILTLASTWLTLAQAYVNFSLQFFMATFQGIWEQIQIQIPH